jgi:hypothetical protein
MKARQTSEGKLLPVQHCPVCQHRLDCATEMGHEDHGCRPHPDDLTLCISCGEVLQFNADYSLRKADLSALMALRKKDLDKIGMAQQIIRDTCLTFSKPA